MSAIQIAHTKTGDRSIGAILIDSGKITISDAELILHLQKEEGIRFGDAAIKLGLLSSEDIQFALSSQYDYPYLIKGNNEISEELIAAYQPFSRQVEALRALRSQLMLRWFTDGEQRKALAVVSPGRGEGRSFLVANLAIVFSQLGERTLVIDADLRNSNQHTLFHLENNSGLSQILANRGAVTSIRRIASFRDLSVLPAGPVPPNPQELLGRPIFRRFLEELGNEFDVIIIDTPAAKRCADAQGIAVVAGGAMLVAHHHETSLKDLAALNEDLRGIGVQVVGSVLAAF